MSGKIAMKKKCDIAITLQMYYKFLKLKNVLDEILVCVDQIKIMKQVA